MKSRRPHFLGAFDAEIGDFRPKIMGRRSRERDQEDVVGRHAFLEQPRDSTHQAVARLPGSGASQHANAAAIRICDLKMWTGEVVAPRHSERAYARTPPAVPSASSPAGRG